MQDISGNVTGKIQFKIDKASWDNLDKFSKKLTNIKRQMGGLDKTIKVQQVVNQIKTVGEKVAKAQVAVKKKEYDGHLNEYRKYQTQMGRMYDQAMREDRRREAQKIRQAERFNAQQLRSDLAKDRQSAKVSAGGRSYDARAERYVETKLLQAKVAGVSEEGLRDLGTRFATIRNVTDLTKDYDALKHSMQMATKQAIDHQRQMKRNAVTFASVRSELVGLTAAYGAFTVVQNIAQTGMKINF